MGILQKIFGKPKPKNPEDHFLVTVTKEFIRVEHPGTETEEILWNDIVEIKLINTDAGPFAPDIWLALLGQSSGCLIPHGAKGFEEVYEIISKYENFNFDNFISSMSCSDNAEFLLWEKI